MRIIKYPDGVIAIVARTVQDVETSLYVACPSDPSKTIEGPVGECAISQIMSLAQPTHDGAQTQLIVDETVRINLEQGTLTRHFTHKIRLPDPLERVVQTFHDAGLASCVPSVTRQPLRDVIGNYCLCLLPRPTKT